MDTNIPALQLTCAAMLLFSLLLSAITWFSRWRAKRRAWHCRRFSDKRFTPDERDWQKRFEIYDRPTISRDER